MISSSNLYFSSGELTIFPYLAFLTGVLTHLWVYRKGEWHLRSPQVLLFYVGLSQLPRIITMLSPGSSMANIIRGQTSSYNPLLLHITGIFVSTIIYRVIFHRLREFPGPFMAKVCSAYKTGLTIPNLDLYRQMRKFHEWYGDIVRIGPGELSLASPEAVKLLHSHKSPTSKGPWYDLFYPQVTLETTRDHADHSRRRKVWDRGFSTKALRGYTPRVKEHGTLLFQRIATTLGNELDMTDWFNFYSFDVMGDLAFGKTFGMLKDGKEHYVLKTLHENMAYLGYLSPVQWIFPVFLKTPILNDEVKRFDQFLLGQVAERRKNEPELPDVFSWLLAEHNKQPETKESQLGLMADARLIVVAGSDTTAATLTNAFFELVKNYQHVYKLREELDQIMTQGEEADIDNLAKSEYLNAVINETLRLHPAIPSGMQRKTPPEGMFLDGTWIPGDVIVQVPFYTVFRDSRCFVDGDSFRPERWTTAPELNKDPSVFIPFSSGAYSCVGKQLALMELRWVISNIVTRYDMKFAPTFNPEKYESQTQDAFTAMPPSLNLIFEKRS